MFRMRHLAIAIAVALTGSLLAAGATSAHAGEEHATNTLLGWSDVGLLAVVLAFGGLYWLLNRDEPDSVDRNSSYRSEELASPGSSELLITTSVANHVDELAGGALIAARRRNVHRGTVDHRRTLN